MSQPPFGHKILGIRMLSHALRLLAQSELRIFVSESYSLELLFILNDTDAPYSVKQLYDAIYAPKPSKQTFDLFVRRLITLGYLTAVDAPDGKTKRILLAEKTRTFLEELRISYVFQ